MPAALMKHEIDPKKDLLSRIGDLSDFDVFNEHVLIGLYERPEKTKSGIFLTEQSRAEDKYQGKAGLIVKMGSAALKDDAQYSWNGTTVGDWVAIRPSDGWPVTVNGVSCRMVEERAIRMRIPAPDAVW